MSQTYVGAASGVMARCDCKNIRLVSQKCLKSVSSPCLVSAHPGNGEIPSNSSTLCYLLWQDRTRGLLATQFIMFWVVRRLDPNNKSGLHSQLETAADCSEESE